MDGVEGDKCINNLFTEKYKTLFNSVSYDSSDIERLRQLITQEAESHSNDDNCNKWSTLST